MQLTNLAVLTSELDFVEYYRSATRDNLERLKFQLTFTEQYPEEDTSSIRSEIAKYTTFLARCDAFCKSRVNMIARLKAQT